MFSAINRHFISAITREQTLVEVTQFDSRRGLVEGPWSFLALYNGGSVKLIKTTHPGYLLKPLRFTGCTC